MSQIEFHEDENGEPYADIAYQGGVLHVSYETTTLFTHGNDRHIDHIFIETEPTEEQARAIGAFIFRQVMPDFDDFANDLISLDFPHIHMPYPHVKDVDAFERSGLVHEVQEPKIIVEDEDEAVVAEAIAHLDEELEYYLGEN